MNSQLLIDRHFYQKFFKVLDKYNIPFWLDSGTLLGLIRDQSNLNHHHHVNISISSDFLDQLLALKSKLSFPYKLSVQIDKSKREWNKRDVAGVVIRCKNRFQAKYSQLKISIKYKTEQKYRWVDERSCKHVDTSFFNQFTTKKFGKREYQIPNDTENYLEARYQNWRVVDEAWIRGIHDKAIVADHIIKKIPQKSGAKPNSHLKKKIKLDGNYHTKIKSMLLDTIDVLNKNNIPYWIDDGTLLGIIRDGDIIPWDNDADISVSGEYAEQVLKLWPQFFPKYIVRKRPMVDKWINSDFRSIKIQTIREKLLKIDFHVDIFLKYKHQDMYRWFNAGAYQQVRAKHFDNLTKIQWMGRTISIPSDPEEYLTLEYGNWKVPDKNFDPYYDCLMIAEKGF